MRNLPANPVVLFAAFVAAIAGHRDALAHTLLVSRGTATVHADHVTVEIEVDAEDILHSPDAPTDDPPDGWRATFEKWVVERAAVLSETIILRDGQGRRLPADPYVPHTPPGLAALEPDQHGLRALRIHYRADYRPIAPLRHLSFQAGPGRAASIGLWQLVCAVRGAGQSDARIVRLTSRGNVETVRIDRTDDGRVVVSGDGRDARDCFEWLGDGLCAEIRAAEDGVHARVEVPLPLLSTWVALPTSDGEYLTVAEQRRVVEALPESWTSPISVRVDDAELLAQPPRFRWVPSDFDLLVEGEPAEVSIWNGRFQVEVFFPFRVPPKDLEMQWNLFNNAVPTVRAFLLDESTSAEHTFSTYAPGFHWRLDR